MDFPPSATPEPVEFDKYRKYGAYHYDFTIGARNWRRFNLLLAARYLTAAKLAAAAAGERVLDAGSGEGVAALLACRAGATVVAVEFDAEACRLGRQIAGAEGFREDRLRFMQENLYRLPFADGSFDKVISLEVIEHMDDVLKYLTELRRVLRPGGRLVVSTPRKRPDGKLQDRYHIEEFDHAGLRSRLAAVFARVEVFSAWPSALEAAYVSNRPFVLAAKLRRARVRYRAWRGDNPFVGPIAPDDRSPLILACAYK